MIAQPWTGGVIAFVLMLVMTPLVIKLAHRVGWVAKPKADRWHKKPTALMGGIAIYSSSTVVMFLLVPYSEIAFLWGGGTLMFVAGLIDDIRALRPWAKLLLQVIATASLLGGGYQFGPDWPLIISVPLTFLWILGITNALNLLDNMDGLAAGVAASIAFMLALFSVLGQHIELAATALVICGAAGGFLVFNFKPARVFMGDSGSLFLGYILAALAIMLQGEAVDTYGITIYVISIVIFAVPILDTTLVSISRTWNGRPISQGGRDHTSHRLVFVGLSERRSVLTLYAISILFGALGFLAYYEPTLFYAILAYACIGIFMFGAHLAQANVYTSRTEPKADSATKQAFMRQLTNSFGRRSKTGLKGFIDLLLVFSSFVVAVHLTIAGESFPGNSYLLLNVLCLASVKLVFFYWAGVYRISWRYAGVGEVVKLGGSSLGASVIALGLLSASYGADVLSAKVFFVDALLFSLCAYGFRISPRFMNNYFNIHRQGDIKVLLYGAGDAGAIVLREIRQNPLYNITPVGFIDDNLSKQGLQIDSLPVLGTLTNLESISKQYAIDEVVIVAQTLGVEQKVQIVEKCNSIDIQCRIFAFSFIDPSVLYKHAVRSYGESFAHV